MERVGLLTLIIMGEGIIGMTKSVATILQNSVGVSSRIIGTVIAAVLLIVSHCAPETRKSLFTYWPVLHLGALF